MKATLSALYRAHVAGLQKKASQALQDEGYPSLLIHSGSLQKKSIFDDQYWPFRPVPHFQHWAPLNWPECAIELRPGLRPRLLAVRDQSFWERPKEPDWNFLAAALDIIELDTPDDILPALHNPARAAFMGENTSRAAQWGVAEDHVNPKGLHERLDALRVHKTPYEIHCLGEANRRAALGHHAVQKAFFDGQRSELHLHLHYLEATSQDDSQTPYKNIVATGTAASILHHVHYQHQDANNPSLLLDAGASFQGYASDITRTYVAKDGTAPAELFSELITRMEALQQALCLRVLVGRPYENLHDEAHQKLGELLVDTKLLKMSAAEAVNRGVTRMFLPHGLGHSLGLQCHDVGCAQIRPRSENAWLRNTRPIEAGQVFTIEPGLYFIDTLMEELKQGPYSGQVDWTTIDALKPFGGIRIEDDLVVLEPNAPQGGAAQNLTRNALNPPSV